MAKSSRPKGKCEFCGREMTRGGMARHLRSCPKREKAIEAANAQSGKVQTLYHLQIQDAWGGDYWLHLEMKGSASLGSLDAYLRSIWLECCGHLSRFSIGGWGGDEIPMSRKAHQVFKKGLELDHIYDFGTSSETTVRVADVRKGKPLTDHPIVLMARNNAPEFECMMCGEPATNLCLECMYEIDKSGMLCDKHAEGHPHTNYGPPMPVVNSPRMGMCGYCGPAEPPY
jgi:hypothetical protein